MCRRDPGYSGRRLPKGAKRWIIAPLTLSSLLLCPLVGQAEPRTLSPLPTQAPYQIPAMPLDQALRTLAVKARLQILFSARDLPAVRSRPLSGPLTPSEALRRLAEPAGLRVLRLDARTYVVVAGLRPPSAAMDAQTRSAESSDRSVRSSRPEPSASAPVTAVTVYAQRSGRLDGSTAGTDFSDTFDASLPQSLLSRDRFEGGMALNITDALATLPDTTVLTTGRSFVSGVDSATRGEGLFIGLRGLSPEFSLILVNGAPVAQGLPHSRGIQMNLIPPEGFSGVVIHRTGRPDLEGDLIAGTLDFSALRAGDIPQRRRTELVLSGRSEQQARRHGEDGEGGSAALLLSGRFGSQDQLGLALSLRRETRRTVTAEMAGVMSARNDNGWAWGWSATAGPRFHGSPMDPQTPERDLVLTALNVGVSEVSSRNSAAMLSVDWRADSNRSVWLSLVDLKSDTRQNSTLSQLVGTDRQWLPDPAGGYRLSLGGVSSRLWYQTNPDVVSLRSAVLGGRFILIGGAPNPGYSWIITPKLVLSQGTSDRPDRIEASVRINQNDRLNTAQAARPYSGLLIDHINGFPQPRLTPDLFSDLDQADLRLLARRAGQKTAQYSGQNRIATSVDAEWIRSAAAGLMGVKMGVSLSDSTRDLTERNWTNDYVGNLTGQAGVTWRDLGVTAGRYWPQAWPGVYGWRTPRVDHQALEALFERYLSPDSFDRCGKLYVNNQNCGTQEGREQVAAAYLMATVTLGPIETLVGLRQEATQVRSRFWFYPVTAAGEQQGDWQTSRSDFDATLPSVFVNWRPDLGRVFRAGLWRSYSRPAPYQLGGGASLQTAAGGETTLKQGNPDLKAITALNLDLHYQARTLQGGWGLSFWSKWLDNYIFESGGAYSGAVGRVEGANWLVTPQNGGRGEVRGVQVEWNRTFRPDLDQASRVVLSATASRQWTWVDLGAAELGRKVSMQSAPDWRASGAVTYDRGPWTLFINARYSGAFLSDYNVLDTPGDWDNLWVRPAFHADLSLHHRFGDAARLELGIANLTDAPGHEAHVGRSSQVLANKVQSGRQFRLGWRIAR